MPVESQNEESHRNQIFSACLELEQDYRTLCQFQAPTCVRLVTSLKHRDVHGEETKRAG